MRIEPGAKRKINGVFKSMRYLVGIGIVVLIWGCSKEKETIAMPQWFINRIVLGDSLFVAYNLLSEDPDSVSFVFTVNDSVKQYGPRNVFKYKLMPGDSVLVSRANFYGSNRRWFTRVDTLRFNYEEPEVIPIIIR